MEDVIPNPEYVCPKTGIRSEYIYDVAERDETRESMPDHAESLEIVAFSNFDLQLFFEDCGKNFGTDPKTILESIKDHVNECSSCEEVYKQAYQKVVRDRKEAFKELGLDEDGHVIGK